MAELRDLVLDDLRLRVLGGAEGEVVALVRETRPEGRVGVPVERGVEDDKDGVARAGPRAGGQDEREESCRTSEEHTERMVVRFQAAWRTASTSTSHAHVTLL